MQTAACTAGAGYCSAISEKNEHNCGHCDVCLEKHRSGLRQGEFDNLREKICGLLQAQPLSYAELIARTEAEQEKADQVVSFLLSEEQLLQKNGKIYLPEATREEVQ